MRELKVVGLDVDGKRIICETDDSGEKFILRSDDRLRAAVRGDKTGSSPTQHRCRGSKRAASQGDSGQDPRGRLRRAGRHAAAGATSRGSSGLPIRCCWSASRAAELATAAHPVLADGPVGADPAGDRDDRTVARGLDPDATNWDAWRNEDGRWTVQLAWKAGLSDLTWRTSGSPPARTAAPSRAFDDAACELIDPNFARPLRPVAPVAQLEFEEPDATRRAPGPTRASPRPHSSPSRPPRPSRRARKGKPPVPAWEDVLLGVRSSGQR